MLSTVGEGLFGLKIDSALYVGAAEVNTMTLSVSRKVTNLLSCISACLFPKHKLHELMPSFSVKYSKPIFLN